MKTVNDSHEAAKNSTGVSSVTGAPRPVLGVPLPPQLAVRSDGAVLLSVKDIPPHVDLKQRQIWTAIVLSSSEMDLAAPRVANADAEIATHLIAHLSRKDVP